MASSAAFPFEGPGPVPTRPGTSVGPAAATPLTPPAPLAPGGVAHRPHELFGFLPYWSIGDWTDAYLRYDLLTTIALFGVGVADDGSLVQSGSGWAAVTGDRAAAIIDHAHQAGVRVVITFESFGTRHNHRFLASAAARATFVREALALVERLGTDGADLDIEELDTVDRTPYRLLVAEYASASHGADPASEVSVATNANVSGARMAADALAGGADRAFMMGYAYRVAATNTTGSVAPLAAIGVRLDLAASLDLYASNAVPMDRVILGLPYFGMTWPTVTSDLHAPRQPDAAGLGHGQVFRPSSLSAAGPPPGAVLDRDLVESSARLTWFDQAKGSWFQTYYDDPVSLAPKYQLAVERGLAGIGIWALGDDRGQPGYWEAIAAALDPGHG